MPSCQTTHPLGGAEEDRTPDPLRARQVLSQLSYGPFLLLRLFSLLRYPRAFVLSRTDVRAFTSLHGCLN